MREDHYQQARRTWKQHSREWNRYLDMLLAGTPEEDLRQQLAKADEAMEAAQKACDETEDTE